MENCTPRIVNPTWSLLLGLLLVEAAALTVVFGGASLVWGLGQPKVEDTSTAVRAELDRQVAAWNKGDLDGFMASYWNDSQLTFYSGGDITQGWQPTLDRYRKRYQAEGKAMGSLKFTDIAVQPLTADVSIARGRWKLTMPDDKNSEGLLTLVLRKINGNWRIVHDHTSVKAPA